MSRERAVLPVWFRRLLFAPVTLAGVCVSCFLLLDLATDERALFDTTAEDRVTGAMATDGMADRRLALRLRFRRHLPALWNGDVLDRRAFARRELAALARGLQSDDPGGREEVALARAALRLQGASAFEPIAARLVEEDVDPREEAVLLDVLVASGVVVEPTRAAFLAARVRSEERTRPAALERTVEAFARGEARVTSVDQEQRLLPVLWRAIEERSPGEERARLLRVFAALRSPGASLTGVPAGDPPTYEELRAWWRSHHLLHEDLDAREKRLAAWLDTRFALWVRGVLALDFGVDARGLPVGAELWRRLAVTVPLMALALFASFALAIPLGVLAARPGGSFLRRALAWFATCLYCTPRYALATVLLVVFAVPGPLGVFPPSWSGGDAPPFARAALPLAVLTLPGLIYVGRYVRAGVLEALEQDYVRTARAKGLSELRIGFRHAFRNAWGPVATLVGDVIPALVGGSVIVEVVFDVPGMGRYVVDALSRRDAQALLAVTLLSAVVTLVGLWLVEAFQWCTDPRRRRAG